jgi:hypothetical protein
LVTIAIFFVGLAALMSICTMIVPSSQRDQVWFTIAIPLIYAFGMLIFPFFRRRERLTVSSTGLEYADGRRTLIADWSEVTVEKRVSTGGYKVTCRGGAFTVGTYVNDYVKLRKVLEYHREAAHDAKATAEQIPSADALIKCMIFAAGLAFVMVEPILAISGLPLDAGRSLMPAGLCFLAFAAFQHFLTLRIRLQAGESGIELKTVIGRRAIPWTEIESVRLTPLWVRVTGSGKQIQFRRVMHPDIVDALLERIDAAKVMGR